MSEDERNHDVREVDVADVTEQQEPVENVRLVTSDPPVESVDDAPKIDRPAVISDGHCPLVVAPDQIDSRRVVETVDDTRIIRREPTLTLQQPTECPSCGKFFERHSLVLNDVNVKDCAIAVSYRQNPRFKLFFDALDISKKKAEVEAEKLQNSGIDVSALIAKRYGS